MSVSPLEQLALALIVSARRLRPYFPGARNQSPDQSTAPASAPETRDFWPIDQVGDRTRRI
ncbi:transposable element gene [Prunus dulcis]|uniref:Transposable element protein n=1 Tax=Prunus dulcis TaxID=3755 RepID=A0A4Y1QWT6_PRUDU|nr:transposable element gene [Prunus dulcis]